MLKCAASKHRVFFFYSQNKAHVPFTAIINHLTAMLVISFYNQNARAPFEVNSVIKFIATDLYTCVYRNNTKYQTRNCTHRISLVKNPRLNNIPLLTSKSLNMMRYSPVAGNIGRGGSYRWISHHFLRITSQEMFYYMVILWE